MWGERERPLIALCHEAWVPRGQAGTRSVCAFAESQDRVTRRLAFPNVVVGERKFAQRRAPRGPGRCDRLRSGPRGFRVRVREERGLRETIVAGPESGADLLGVTANALEKS